MNKVLIIGAEMPNTGDAAIVQGEIETVRAAFGRHVDVVVFDQWPDISKTLYPELDIRPVLVWPRPGQSRTRVTPSLVLRVSKLLLAAILIRAGWTMAARLVAGDADVTDLLTYRDASLILTAGGTALLPQYWSPGRLVDYLVVLVLRRPLVFFTQTLAPFERRWQRALMRFILKRSRLVLVRGEESAATATTLGAPPARVRIAADAAFALVDLTEVRAARTASTPAGGLSVALSVREWSHFATADGQAAYESAIRDLIVHLVGSRTAHVTLVSTCQGLDEYAVDDSVPARRVMSGLPSSVAARVVLDTTYRRPAELMTELAGFDVAIATRMHFGILALCGGTPVVPIAYGSKTHEVYRRLGNEAVLDIDGITGAQLISRVEQYLTSLDASRPVLFDDVLHEAAGAAAVADALRELVAI